MSFSGRDVRDDLPPDASHTRRATSLVPHHRSWKRSRDQGPSTTRRFVWGGWVSLNLLPDGPSWTLAHGTASFRSRLNGGALAGPRHRPLCVARAWMGTGERQSRIRARPHGARV